MEHDPHPTELLAGYALGILEPAETAEVKAHLAGCPQCQAEVAALEEVSDLLTLAVPIIEAPESVRQRLRQQTGKTTGTAVSPPQKMEKQSKNPLRRWLFQPGLRPLALAFILLLIVSNLYLLFRLQAAGRQSPPEQQNIHLGATDAAPGADGLLLIRQGEQTGTLFVNGLPDLGPEQQYQLWLVNDNGRVSGAVFSVEEEGITAVPVSAPESLPAYYRFGITIEPAGGSPGPTGDGVLRSAVEN